MFESSLLESSDRLRSRLSWTTVASAALQSLALGLSVLIPLLHTEALPTVRKVMLPVPIPRGTPSHLPPDSGNHGSLPTQPSPAIPVAPSKVPPLVLQSASDDPSSPPQISLPGGCVVCAPNGVPHSVGDILRSTPLPAPIPRQKRPIVSPGVTAGRLIHRVQPVYPHLARVGGVEGTVVLHAIITRTGTIESLRIVSGHPMLQQAAVEAVQQWRYRPFFLGDAPVEVETQITVNFVLARNR